MEISISKTDKYTLPVGPTCLWQHVGSITKDGACKTYRGKPVANHNDLWGCVKEAACNITDDRQQFVVMRDPRPVAVSSYYHRLRKGHFKSFVQKDMFIMGVLPYICQWMAVRHILFTELIPQQSCVFWYDDTLADPFTFHTRWFEAAGLHLPRYVVDSAVEAATRNGFEFELKGVDSHPGGEEATLVRSWRDEIDKIFLPEIDDILRVLLPPALLARFDI